MQDIHDKEFESFLNQQARADKPVETATSKILTKVASLFEKKYSTRNRMKVAATLALGGMDPREAVYFVKESGASSSFVPGQGISFSRIVSGLKEAKLTKAGEVLEGAIKLGGINPRKEVDKISAGRIIKVSRCVKAAEYLVPWLSSKEYGSRRFSSSLAGTRKAE